MAIKDLALDVARKAKRVAGKVVDALEGSGKTHVVSERSELYRIPMPNGVPLLALVTAKRMRTTYDALKDPREFAVHEICTADNRAGTVSGPGLLTDTMGSFICRATDGFYQLRVTTSALSCQECAGCGIVRDDRCAACEGSGNRSVRDCIRHIALNLQKTVPSDDHDALLHVAMSAMRETDEFYARLCEQTKAHYRTEHMDGLRACVIFYLGAMARVSSIGPVPQFKELQTTQPFHTRINLLSRAAAAAGMYASLVVTHLAASAYHRSESARLLTLLGLESRSGGLTVDSFGMTIFTEVRPDGITVQDVWSPEFFRRVMDDCGTSLQGDLFADYVQRVNQITWAIESAAQRAGMPPGGSLAAFIDQLRTERNEAQDKLSEALSTLNG
jgi:hypothetical protein